MIETDERRLHAPHCSQAGLSITAGCPECEGGIAYVAMRIKASDPLPPCPDCGTTNNLTHNEDCDFADWDDAYTEDECAAIVNASLKALHEHPRVFGDPAKTGGVVESAKGERFLVGERGPETIIPLPPGGVKRTLTPEEGAGKPVKVTIQFDQGLELLEKGWACPACGGKERGYALRCAKCFPERTFVAEAMKRAIAQLATGFGHDPKTLIIDDPFANSYITADDLRAAVGAFDCKPRRSIIAAMMSARRARAKRAPFASRPDEPLHRAISAMQKPGRANEL